jgi:hypothetical protein
MYIQDNLQLIKNIDSPSGLLTVLATSIVNKITGAGFPQGFRGKELFLCADFSGTHRDSLYTTYAFMLLDLDKNDWWFAAQRAFRSEALKNKRRMSFKALNDNAKRRALLPFLLMADEIEGALVIVGIEKSHGSIFSPQDSNNYRNLTGAWKPAVHEHLMRVTYLSALCTALMSVPRQNLIWICDQDDVVSNDNQIVALTNLFAAVSSHMMSYNLGRLRLGCAKSDNGSLQIEDLVAIPDLAAGAACELLSCFTRQKIFPVTGLYNRMPIGLSAKAHRLAGWLSVSDRPLKRFIVAVRSDEGGTCRVTSLKLSKIPDLIIR